MRSSALLVLVLLTVPISGCVVPQNMTALREDLGYTSVELPDLVARARATTLTPRVYETVTFTADVEGITPTNATYTWTIGNRTLEGREVTHAFETPGTVPVHLGIHTARDLTGNDSLELDVRDNAVPRARITVENRENLTAETPVAVSGRASSDPDGDALSYAWTIDGETVSTQPQFARSLAAGTHEIELAVDDGIERSLSFTTVAVAEPIDAEGRVTLQAPTLALPLETVENVDQLAVRLTHSTNGGLDDVQLALVDADGQTIAATHDEPAPGATSARETLTVPGAEVPPGEYTLEARLDRGADADVAIQGLVSYAASP